MKKLFVSFFVILVLSLFPFSAFADEIDLTPTPTPLPQATNKLTVITPPTVTDIVFGQTVSSSVFLDNGIVKNSLGEEIFGGWAWQSPNAPSGTGQSVTSIAVFTPFDSKYNPVLQNITIKVNPADAPSVSLTSFQTGNVRREGAGYALTVPAETTSVTFSVVSSGILANGVLNYRLEVAALQNPAVTATTAGRDTPLKNGEILVTLSLNPNEEDLDRESSVHFIFSQPSNSYSSIPDSFTLRVIQEKSPYAKANLAAELLVPIVQSTNEMPSVNVYGNEVQLTYNSVAATILTGSAFGFTLIIPDYRILSANTPYTVKGFKVQIDGVENSSEISAVIPGIQVNHILQQLVNNLAADTIQYLYYGEDGAIKEGEPVKLVHDSLKSNSSDDIKFVVDEEGFTVSDNSKLSLTADYNALLSRAGKDFKINGYIEYKGIRSDPMPLSFNITSMTYFPYFSLMEPAEGIEDEEPGTDIFEGRPSGSYGSKTLAYQSYDPTTNRFLHLTSFGTFFTNIPYGYISNSDVMLIFDEKVSVILYKNGEITDYSSNQRISESGSYKAVFIPNPEATTGNLSENMDPANNLEMLGKLLTETTDSVSFDFEISNIPSNRHYYFYAPMGFEIESIKFEEKEIPINSKFYFKSEREGTYEVQLLHKEEENLRLTSRFTFDKTPPELELIGVQNGQTTYDTVFMNFADTESHSTYECTYENAPFNYTSTKGFSEPGIYRITYTDQAGNSSYYVFKINYSLNVSGIGVLVTAVLVTGGLGGYLYYERKNLRVR